MTQISVGDTGSDVTYDVAAHLAECVDQGWELVTAMPSLVGSMSSGKTTVHTTFVFIWTVPKTYRSSVLKTAGATHNWSGSPASSTSPDANARSEDLLVDLTVLDGDGDESRANDPIA